MNIRCGNCQSAVWIQLDTRGVRSESEVCDRCEQRYRIQWPKLHSPRRLAAAARTLSIEHRIDLPSAYSITLGVMSLAEALEFSNLDSTARARPGPVPDPDPASRHKSRTYDPAFEPAIVAGTLTPRQAAQRGRRDACAETVAGKHRLPLELAYAVTDNRMSLLHAIRKSARSNAVPHKVRVRPPVSAAWRQGPVAALLIVALAAVLYVSSGRERNSTTVHRKTRVAEGYVHSGDAGQILQVTGPDPQSVLRAFCAFGGPSGAFNAIRVTMAPSSGQPVRLGLLRDPRDPSRLLSIEIVEDQERDRWVAGDGKQELRPTEAPPGINASFVRGSGSGTP